MAIDLRQLIKSGVQFGHQTWRWNPKMAAYIWGQKNGIYLIDVSKTAYQLEKAAQFLESVAAEGKSILWCGTKKAARKAIEQVAEVTHCPTVSHRWIGGTLTNYIQVKKSVTKLLHLEDVLAKSGGEHSHHTKKELSVFSKKVERIDKNVGGIRKLVWPVGALVVVDVKKEHVAIREAQASGVPVVALVDTNSDPSGIDYVIPTNDDAPKAIECITTILAEAVVRGQKVAAPQKEVAEEITTPSVDEVLAKALGGLEESGDEEKKKPSRAPVRRAPRRPSSEGKK